jgi:hypothetical protein
MSDTDKTCPWAVRALKDPKQYLKEVHFHGAGECTHPATLTLATLDKKLYSWQLPNQSIGCGWTYTTAFEFERDSGCGCPICTNRAGRRLDRRRSRHTWRQQEDRLHGGRDVPGNIFDGVLADPDTYLVRFSALAAAVAATLDLPDGSLIVDLEDSHSRAADSNQDHELVAAEVMHNDGTRERIELPAGVWTAPTMSQLLDMGDALAATTTMP